jgi:glycosyltransferase involved in cell wall biosynthesis
LDKKNYVLITAARNEEAYIEATIKSVLSQTILPKKWIIISDGSTDGTDKIAMQYANENDFIELIRRKGINKGIDFSSKVHSIYEGYKQLN